MKQSRGQDLFGLREPGRFTAAGLVDLEADGQEAIQRLMEQDNPFWDEEEAAKPMPVKRFTREEAIAAGYNVSRNYA